ncbi:MAG: DUF3179 domain-containing protein [Rhizobiaceae bacterium]
MFVRLFVLIVAVLLAYPVAADPNPKGFENWKTDFSITSVEMSEIRSGGPPKDGIPPIDDPKFVDVSIENQLVDQEPVIMLEVNGDARAYPLSVLMWHEIANDVIGGEPVSVTYCPLCNASIVFSAMVDDRKLDFGTTGRLRNSDLIMYDRQTETWWQQFSGKAIVGELTGAKLKMLPSTTVSWATFKKKYPEGKVLIPNNPEFRQYGRNPYAYYDTANRPFLYSGSMPKGIEPMARVIIVEDKDVEFVVTMDAVREAGTFEKDGVVINWTEGMASALDSSSIADGRDIGQITVTRKSDGTALVHHVTFAFVAHAFHEDIEITGI